MSDGRPTESTISLLAQLPEHLMTSRPFPGIIDNFFLQTGHNASTLSKVLREFAEHSLLVRCRCRRLLLRRRLRCPILRLADHIKLFCSSKLGRYVRAYFRTAIFSCLL